MPTQRKLNDDELNQEIAQILPAGDRLRLVTLDRTQTFAAAKLRSLQRELRFLQARQPEDAAGLREATRRVELQQAFATQTTSEIQRAETVAPTRNPGTLTLHGRVVNRAGLGQAGLVVSVIGADGRAGAFTCTDDNGAFRLEIPASTDGAPSAVTLLVSNSDQAILARGTEAFPVVGNRVIYREIVLGGELGKRVPTPPPPVPERVLVPNVIGQKSNSAVQLLQRAGLLAILEERVVDNEKIGLITTQNPPARVSVEAGSSVKLTVGAAGRTVSVPPVVGLTFAAATDLLKHAQLAVGTVEPPNPGNKGLVLEQKPKPGGQLERGSPVDLKVQPPVVRPPTVSVPNLVRLTPEESRPVLDNAKLKLGKITFQRTPRNEVGRIVAQEPKAGSPVGPGTEIAIVVGENDQRQMPDVIDQTLRAARASLKRVNLNIARTEPEAAPDQSVVVKQSPPAGVEVNESTPIILQLRSQLQPPGPINRSVSARQSKDNPPKATGRKRTRTQLNPPSST